MMNSKNAAATTTILTQILRAPDATNMHTNCYDFIFNMYNFIFVMTLNNSDFTVVIVTVSSASGSLKAEPKECLTGKGQVLSKGLRAERISRWLTSILLLIKIV